MLDFQSLIQPIYKILPLNIWYFILHSTKYHLTFDFRNKKHEIKILLVENISPGNNYRNE